MISIGILPISKLDILPIPKYTVLLYMLVILPGPGFFNSWQCKMRKSPAGVREAPGIPTTIPLIPVLHPHR